MVLGGTSLQLADMDPLRTFPQVCINTPFSSPFHFRGLRVRSQSQASATAAEVTQEKEPARSVRSFANIKPGRKFQHKRKGLEALSELLPAQSHSEELCSHVDSSKQALQRLREPSSPRAELKSNRGVSSEKGRNRLFLDPPLHLQSSEKDAQSADLRSSHVDGTAPIDSRVSGQRKMPPMRRRGSRHSSRGFDVLDDLMSSQGRSSKALLESLQAEVTLEKKESLILERDSKEDARANSLMGQKAPSGQYYGGTMQQTLSEPQMADRWQPIDDKDTIETASTTSAFASSIGKALSPSVTTKVGTAANANMKNMSATMNTSALQATTSYSVREDVSDRRKPTLRGQEVLWALQKAALEKAKQKQRNRKPHDRAPKGKEIAVSHDSGEWRNAKPIVLKPEWALEIENLEKLIEKLKNSMLSAAQ